MPAVLVIGASRGIGEEFARQYRADGWTVIATVRTEEAAAPLGAAGISTHRLDVRDPAAIAALADRLNGVPIDVLVVNAGIYEGLEARLDDIGPEALLDSFRVNAVAPILVARAFRRHLRLGDQRKIVAMSSLLGSISRNARPGHIAYRSSKAALNAAWRALALEEPDLIALLIRPGRVRTAMTNHAGDLSATDSVSAMRRLIGSASATDSGRFLDYAGVETSW